MADENQDVQRQGCLPAIFLGVLFWAAVAIGILIAIASGGAK